MLFNRFKIKTTPHGRLFSNCWWAQIADMIDWMPEYMQIISNRQKYRKQRSWKTDWTGRDAGSLAGSQTGPRDWKANWTVEKTCVDGTPCDFSGKESIAHIRRATLNKNHENRILDSNRPQRSPIASRLRLPPHAGLFSSWWWTQIVSILGWMPE